MAGGGGGVGEWGNSLVYFVSPLLGNAKGIKCRCFVE